jgi:hypothetical protein
MISMKIIDFRKRNYGRETLGFGKQVWVKHSHFLFFESHACSLCSIFHIGKKLKEIHHSYTTTHSHTIFVILSTKTSKFYRRSTQRKAIPFVSTEYNSQENNSHLEKKKNGFHGNKQQLRKKLLKTISRLIKIVSVTMTTPFFFFLLKTCI